ncbi:MAG TPA: UDP-N-acetylmuramoyl-L-alanyl-D-glutamate--2,6-diaminopimelate ligase [Gammaproteobacteria bacterium]|nr:UDP-N-acetylmuramoyl-L-alanyl-D-glutamate--2,6-diaminopimelate ligase [Gammaproteobacteria bacterium]
MAAALDMTGVTIGELCGAGAGMQAAIEITDLVLDSRDVRPGAGFVALPGARAHGLDFAAQALASGAAVVLYDPATVTGPVPQPSVAVADLRSRLGEFARRLYARKAARVVVVGVTGTNGKTTVAWLLAQALTRAGRTAGYIGTLGHGIVPQLAEHRLTTPDCLSLHREIAMMPVTGVALEVSSHALVQDRLAGVDVSGAVFTNLSHDHLDAHGSIEAYAQAKARLFARAELEHAVVNADDAFAAKMRAAAASDVRILSVSRRSDQGADLCCVIASQGVRGMSLRASGAYGAARIDVPLIGEFNASNVLLTLGALVNLDVPFAEACDALRHSSAPPGRMETFGGGQQPLVVVDYAHSPDALARVLTTLRGLCTGELWCVFGCGGDRDTSKRAAMGAAAGRADHVIITDDNPRSEDPEEIVAGIVAGLGEHRNVVIEHDRAAAIGQAISQARGGDVVLVAGRGHERLQLRRDGAIELDDRQCVVDRLGLRP